MMKKRKVVLRRKRRVRYVHPSDIKRVKKMIPSFKKQKFKFLH